MKEPLLLVHGFTDSRRTWDPMIPRLEDRFELIIPSLTGHRGGPPIPDGMTDPLGTMADGLERELDAAGHDRAHIHGNSLGGWLSFMLAQRGRALTVVATSPAHGWEGDEPPRVAVRRFRNAHRVAPLGVKLARTLAARPGLRKLALRDHIEHPERVRPDTAVELILGNAECTIFDAYYEQIEANAYRQSFGDLGVPTRIAWGTRDTTLPIKTCSSWFRETLPDAEWVDLPDCGHLPHHDDPDLVARQILEVTAAHPAGSAP